MTVLDKTPGAVIVSLKSNEFVLTIQGGLTEIMAGEGKIHLINPHGPNTDNVAHQFLQAILERGINPDRP